MQFASVCKIYISSYLFCITFSRTKYFMTRCKEEDNEYSSFLDMTTVGLELAELALTHTAILDPNKKPKF